MPKRSQINEYSDPLYVSTFVIGDLHLPQIRNVNNYKGHTIGSLEGGRKLEEYGILHGMHLVRQICKAHWPYPCPNALGA